MATARSTRDYIYVGDVVEANRLALAGGDGGTFNIGTGRETTVREVFDTVRGAVETHSPAAPTTARANRSTRSGTGG